MKKALLQQKFNHNNKMIEESEGITPLSETEIEKEEVKDQSKRG